MEISKITAKGRVTIPHALRKAADLKTGDKLVFELDGDSLIVTKFRPAESSRSRAFLNLEEWLSDEDEEAWRDL